MSRSFETTEGRHCKDVLRALDRFAARWGLHPRPVRVRRVTVVQLRRRRIYHVEQLRLVNYQISRQYMEGIA